MSRRVKCYEVDRGMFAELMKDGTEFRVSSGIPENAEIVSTGLRPGADTFYVIAEHENFPETEEGTFLDIGKIPSGEIIVKDERENHG